jgi:hypothetical protein
VFLFRCTAEELNVTDVKGQILLCFQYPNDRTALDPGNIFGPVSRFVRNRGGSGLIFAQYTTDILTGTICQGIACVLVDFDTATEIEKYWIASRYVHSI